MKNVIFSIIWAVFILVNGAEAATFKADKPTILITGANRGLGLEFVRQYAAKLISMGTLQKETKDKGILITMISPGHVDTQVSRDSGWTGPTITAEKSTGLVIDRIAVIDKSVAGKLIMCNGKVLPW